MSRGKAVVYIRVSSTEQVDGASLEVQKKACIAFAENELNCDVIRPIFREEGKSAKTANRPVLIEMLKYVQAHKGEIDYAIFYDTSRASRDSDSYFGTVKAILNKYGVKTRYVMERGIDETPAGKLLEAIMVGMAEFENNLKSEKVHESMAERAKQGYWVTQPPIGFKIKVVMGDGNLVDSEGRKNRVKFPKILVPDTTIRLGETLSISEKLAKIFRCFAEGNMSESEAYDMALSMGIKGKNGKPITFGRFDDILRSPVYAGYNESEALLGKGVMVKAKFDGLVSKEVYDRVQAILNSNKRDLMPKKKELYPLDGTLMCECGKPIHGDAPTDGSGCNVPRYYCRKGKGGTHGYQSVKANDIHEAFDNLLQEICPTEGMIRLFKEILKRTAVEKLGSVNIALEANRKTETELDEQKTRILQLLVKGDIDKDEKDRLMLKTDEERLKLRQERMELEKQQSLNETTIEYVCNFMNQPAKLWKDADLESKQALQKMMFPNGLHVDLKTKKCRTEDLSPLFSIISNKKAPKGGNSDSMVNLHRFGLLLAKIPWRQPYRCIFVPCHCIGRTCV